MGLNTSESGSDSKLSTQSVRMIIINDARRDPTEVGNPDVTDDTSANEASKEEGPIPWKSARCKRPTPRLLSMWSSDHGGV